MGEELFLTSLKVMLILFEYKRLRKENSHTMVTLKGRFKVETW